MPTLPPRTRHTIAARNTQERPTASLDAESAVCLEWAAHQMAALHNLRPQPAVVIRRALSVYVHHLMHMDPDHTRGELMALDQAGKGTGTARTLLEARARMEACQGTPMAWAEARYSPEQRKEQQDTMAAIEKSLGARQ